MKLMYILCAIGMLMAGAVGAQNKESILAEGKTASPFDKKFYWGLSFNQYWGNIYGDNLVRDYFGKPCLGASVRGEYYPLPFLGVGVGAGVQQRGAGILNPDKSGGSFTHPWDFPQFNGDSTYRERLRFTTLELPITLLLRTPKDIVKGVRLSAAAGLSLVRVVKANDIFLSVEDGYHFDQVVKKDYLKSDLAYQLSFGTDIDMAGSSVFQVHFVYTKGTRNIYANPPGDGRLATYGIRVAWLY